MQRGWQRVLRTDKITRMDVRDQNDQLLLSNVNYELSGRLSANMQVEVVIIKGSELPELERETPVSLVAHYSHGDRLCYSAHVAIATQLQWNLRLCGEPHKLRERRRFFKVAAELPVLVEACVRDRDEEEEEEEFDPPIQMQTQDINLGGVYLLAPLGDKRVMQAGDLLSVALYIEEERIETTLEVLRVRERKDSEGVIHGYGCRFTALSTMQEQILAGYIYKYQWNHKE